MTSFYNKRAQQEMVGFVLIVVLVVVALMVFLVISLRSGQEAETTGVITSNMLHALLSYTTDCALVFEPQFESVEDLFKSSFEGRRCSNKEILASDYLNSTVLTILDSLVATEATIHAYRLSFVERSDEGEEGLLSLSSGNCTGVIESAQRSLISGPHKLVIRLSTCRNI